MTEEERKAKIAKYFKYNYSGIITNIKDDSTMKFAGSDFDGDIAYSTDNSNIIEGIYQNEKVTAYEVPKPKKIANISEEDLFKSDSFSFGQQINQGIVCL